MSNVSKSILMFPYWFIISLKLDLPNSILFKKRKLFNMSIILWDNWIPGLNSILLIGKAWWTLVNELKTSFNKACFEHTPLTGHVLELIGSTHQVIEQFLIDKRRGNNKRVKLVISCLFISMSYLVYTVIEYFKIIF